MLCSGAVSTGPALQQQRRLVATSPASPEHAELQRKREDMDKVISELTKAVMKSRNVTTLTRAMRNKYSSAENQDNQGGAGGSSDNTNRRPRRHPLRNSIRTLRSISKGTKGSVDVVKNLWQQVLFPFHFHFEIPIGEIQSFIK